MAPQCGNDVVRVDAYDIAKLAGRARLARDGVDRPVGIAGDESEHLEARPAEHAIGQLCEPGERERRHGGLTP